MGTRAGSFQLDVMLLSKEKKDTEHRESSRLRKRESRKKAKIRKQSNERQMRCRKKSSPSKMIISKNIIKIAKKKSK